MQSDLKQRRGDGFAGSEVPPSQGTGMLHRSKSGDTVWAGFTAMVRNETLDRLNSLPPERSSPDRLQSKGGPDTPQRLQNGEPPNNFGRTPLEISISIRQKSLTASPRPADSVQWYHNFRRGDSEDRHFSYFGTPTLVYALRLYEG